MSNNLYLVKTKGMQISFTETAYGVSYVVASDPTTAYKIVKEFLDKNNIGWNHERVLESVTLIAQTGRYPTCRTMLFEGGKQ